MRYVNYVRLDGRVAGQDKSGQIFNKIRQQNNRIVHNMDWFMGEENKILGKWMRKSAKLRAPRSPSGTMGRGTLANSIMLRVRGKRYIALRANAPYAGYQEQGYAPHFVSPYKHPKLASWYKAKTGEDPPPVIMVSEHKPFMDPAFHAAAQRIPRILNKVSEKSISRTGYRRVG